MAYKLYGAAGFAAGGLIAGLSGDYMLFSFLLFGLIGSAVLSLPANDKRLTVLSGLVGAIGFFIGFTVPMFLSMTLFDLPFMVTGVVMGLVGGSLLGILYKNIVGFTLAGIVGFGIWGAMIDLFRPLYSSIHASIIMMIASAIAGAILGFAVSASKREVKK